MKKVIKIDFYLKYFPFLSYILFIGLLASSCRKDQVSIASHDEIKNAEEWFKVQKDVNFYPRWNLATIKTQGNHTFVVVPSNYIVNPIGSTTVQSYLVIDASAESPSGKIIEYINSTIDDRLILPLFNFVFGDRTEVPSVKGNVLVFNLQHNFLEGFKFNGEQKPNKLVVFKENRNLKSGRGARGKQMSIDHELTDCASYYYVTWDAHSGEILSSTFLYTECEGNAGGGGNGSGGGGGTGGDGSNPSNPKVDVDPAARPCLGQIKSTLEALGLKTSISDGTGLIASILNKLNLSTGSNFNAIITEGTILPGALATTTLTANLNPLWGTQGTVSQIKFSSEHLNKMTELKVAATMMHEYVHAYFDWNASLIRNGQAGYDPGFQEKYTLLFDKTGKPLPDDFKGNIQHEQMSRNFVREIAVMLRNYAVAQEIPMPADQEYFNKMAWGGLLGTAAGKFAPEGTEYTLSAEQGTSGTTITTQTKCKQ